MKVTIKLFLAITLICLCTNGFADDLKKKIVGKWYSPYNYEELGEKVGFHFKKNGTCESTNKEVLDLRKWDLKDGKLIIEGLCKDEKTGRWEEYRTEEELEKVNNDTFLVVASREPVLIKFLYLSRKALKEKVTPPVKKQ